MVTSLVNGMVMEYPKSFSLAILFLYPLHTIIIQNLLNNIFSQAKVDLYFIVIQSLVLVHSHFLDRTRVTGIG